MFVILSFPLKVGKRKMGLEYICVLNKSKHIRDEFLFFNLHKMLGPEGGWGVGLCLDKIERAAGMCYLEIFIIIIII